MVHVFTPRPTTVVCYSAVLEYLIVFHRHFLLMEGAIKKRKRLVLTIKEKIDICNRLERGENGNKLMKEYGIGSSTMHDIRQQKDELLKFYSAAESTKAITKFRVLRKSKLINLT
jgi:hypothetical protein